jgi:tetratricopeptide (TPR) repeat protein
MMSAAGGVALLWLASTAHAADQQLWKTYCNDARKSANERRFTEANQFMSMALAVAEQFGKADLRLVETLFLAANIQEADEQFAEAEPHLRRALALRESKLGSNDLNVAECAFYLGGNLTEQRKFAEAEVLLKRAEHIAKWKTSSYHPVVGTCQAALARNCSLAGRYDEANKLYTAALRILGTQSTTRRFTAPNRVRESTFIPDYPKVMQIRLEQAQTLHVAKKYKDAEEAFKKLVKLVEDVEGKDSDLLMNPLLAFSRHYADTKKLPAAEALLLRRQAIVTKHAGASHPEHLVTKAALERVYREQGKQAEADLLARQLAEAGAKPVPGK